MKRFNYDHQLRVYMYSCMYVDPETMEKDGYFPDTKTFVADYNKMSNSDPVPKHWL